MMNKKEIIGICEFLRVHHFENSYKLLDYYNKYNKYKEVIDKIKDITNNILEQFEKIPDKELLTNRCVDINVIEMIKKELEEIE